MTMKILKSFNIKYRLGFVITLIALLLGLVILTIASLDTVQRHFLLSKSTQESLHTIELPAKRGIIFDRNHIPLAVSTPLYNVILDPKVLLAHPTQLQQLLASSVLADQAQTLLQAIEQKPQSRYLLAAKNLTPAQKTELKELKVPGVYLKQLYQTYYPEGPALAQLVGFTNFDNVGQEGIELSFNRQLAGHKALVSAYETAMGQILHFTSDLKSYQAGQDITLSIDARLQYFAYEALKNEVEKVSAISGSVSIMNPYTGEVLAAVSYPSFNPNDVSQRTGPGLRNRALTDQFEPGSTMKTFTISAALESGKYTPTTTVDTTPGWLIIQGHKIHDDEEIDVTNVTGVLQHSSNVGAAKIALSLPWSTTYNFMQRMGFGESPSNMFPGETAGIMHPLTHMSTLEFATMAFGYDITASTLQLARAYSAIANGGTLYPATFLKLDTPPKGTKVLSKAITQEMMPMLHTVVEKGGTTNYANIVGYTVVGKTGTSHKVGPGGFERNKYNAIFVGIAPMEHPLMVIAVHINEPHDKPWFYGFGGNSAAPVFADIAANAMRVWGVPAKIS